MNKYIAILKQKKKGALSAELLQSHIQHLRQLTALNQLYLCGPFKDNDGALQILIAKDKQTAELILNQDPFIKERYYQSYELFELIEANETNNWLYEASQTLKNLQ